MSKFSDEMTAAWNRGQMRQRNLSQVAKHTDDGQLMCPVCGGQQFTAKRSGAGLVGFGLLAPKTKVRCVTCNTTFKRG